jgi:hippurate hydrolase
MSKPIPNSIADMAVTLSEWRRDLHAHPELAYEEVRTAGIVAAKLRAFGFDVIEEGVGGTGVVGVLHGADGPAKGAEQRVLFRADMDALPIIEATGAPHASTNPGKMHACGHDGHTTMLLGAAKHLAETRNFNGSVVFCFQPAEEGGGGAKAMLDHGMLERHPCREAFGMHNWPGMPVGEFRATAGPVMASADMFEITVTGKGGHGALPHLARDPIVAGAHLVTALQTIVSRLVEPIKPAVLSVTTFHAGSTTNVIPAEAKLSGTVRAFHREVRDLIYDEMQRICQRVGDTFGVTIAFDGGPTSYPPTVNDAAATAFAAGVLDEVVGPERVHRQADPTMGSEDFSFIASAVPSSFVFIGNGDSADLHHPRYDFDDSAAPIGVAFWTKLAEKALPRDA